jgi:hypothetical protein
MGLSLNLRNQPACSVCPSPFRSAEKQENKKSRKKKRKVGYMLEKKTPKKTQSLVEKQKTKTRKALSLGGNRKEDRTERIQKQPVVGRNDFWW